MANRAILSFWYLIIFGIDKQEYRLLLVIAVFMALERQILIILEVGELGTSSGAVVIKEGKWEKETEYMETGKERNKLIQL